MKNLSLALALMASLAIAPLTPAQTGDWQVVESLPQRSLISVEDMHHVVHATCRFQGVVDGQLMCEYGPFLAGRNEIAFRRESIRAVRRDHNAALIGFTIGAGYGAVVGAVRDDNGIGRGGSAVVGGVFCGGLGALAGAISGHFVHGKVIYRNPGDTTQPSGTSQAQDSASHAQDSAPANDIVPAYQTASYRIVAARSQYTRLDDASPSANDSDTLAQFPSRRPGMYPRRGGYPRSAYPSMYRPEVNGRHVLIGALIGFGIGAAVVAKGHGTAGATVAIGMIGAGIGAGMGAGMPSYYARSRYRRGPRPDDEDELASRSEPSKPSSPRQADQDPPAALESARAQATH